MGKTFWGNILLKFINGNQADIKADVYSGSTCTSGVLREGLDTRVLFQKFGVFRCTSKPCWEHSWGCNGAPRQCPLDGLASIYADGRSLLMTFTDWRPWSEEDGRCNGWELALHLRLGRADWRTSHSRRGKGLVYWTSRGKVGACIARVWQWLEGKNLNAMQCRHRMYGASV